VVKVAEADGFTTTLYGRRRYIPEFRDTKQSVKAFGKRIAMNAPIQGSAADIMKLAMIAADKRIKESGIDARAVMQVHDELILEVKDDQIDKAKALLKEAMESVCTLNVPLTVEVTSGKNWLEQE
jgi:DNA polymerase-1